MKCNVFLLREKGARLATEAVQASGPVKGELLYRQRIPRSDCFLATLLAEDMETYLVPPLDGACIKHITPTGMMIIGVEVHTRGSGIKGRTTGFRQSWWCVPA